MSRSWPAKEDREQFEIESLVSYYKTLPHGRDLEIVRKGEQPDFVLRDSTTGGLVGVELTSVYLDKKSVPHRHMVSIESPVEIEYKPELITKYIDRLVAAVEKKVQLARKSYDCSMPLLLSIYVNEYESIHMDVEDWEDLVKKHEQVFDDVAPFIEVLFWPIPGKGVFSVRPFST